MRVSFPGAPGRAWRSHDARRREQRCARDGLGDEPDDQQDPDLCSCPHSWDPGGAHLLRHNLIASLKQPGLLVADAPIDSFYIRAVLHRSPTRWPIRTVLTASVVSPKFPARGMIANRKILLSNI